MKYTTEELTPCSKKIHVTVSAEEVNAAISSALTMQQQGLSLAGFRKGHVPLAIIEKRFKGQIYADAAQDLTNVHLNEILGELKVRPVSMLIVDPTPIQLVRDQDCNYTVSFEHMPTFELPAYDGLEIEQKEPAEPSDDRINAYIDRLVDSDAKFVPIDGEGPAADGQLCNIDLDIYEGEKVLHSMHGQDLAVGQVGAAEIDDLVKTIKVGQTGEKEMTFAQDFLMPELQGKTCRVVITVHAIKEKKAPTPEEFAKKVNLNGVEELRQKSSELLKSQMASLYKDEAKTKLIEKLLGMVDFELPPSIVENELSVMVQNDAYQAERMGKALSDEQIKEAKEKHMDQAKRNTKIYVLLLTIAQNEGLSVTDEQVRMQVERTAARMHYNPTELYNYYRENGYLYTIRDNMLIDMATNAIYAKAKVTTVPETAQEPAAEEKAPEA